MKLHLLEIGRGWGEIFYLTQGGNERQAVVIVTLADNKMLGVS
jgi:hypothetical protein